MKIILLQDIAKIGKKFDLVEVSDGYALNYLIPRGLAETATPSKERETEKRKEEEKAKRDARVEKISKEIADLKSKPVLVEVKANEKGKLFASLEKKHIISALKNQYKIDLDKADINLEEPIKEVGDHEVSINLEKKEFKLTFSVKAKK